MSKALVDADSMHSGLLSDGITIAWGGFALCGIPALVLEVISRAETCNLTVASNNAGVDGFGHGQLVDTRQVRKMFPTDLGANADCMRQYW